MNLTDLHPWVHDAADLKREEQKRWYSPSSFFFSQGQSLVLAASYFRDTRLTSTARGGVARKHRHRIHLALFGQLMASLEYLFKDFIAQVIDLTDVFDEKVKKAKWIEVDAGHVLSVRTVKTTPGALLLHSTLGWQDSRTVNVRYSDLFLFQPIDQPEIDTLDRLWVLRHSVAHNAGFVTARDAARAGVPALSNAVVDLNEEFIRETFDFLCNIAKRVATEVGDRVVLEWLRSKKEVEANWKRDKQTYTWLKYLAAYIPSRARELPKIRKGTYTADFARANAPP